MKLQLSKFDKIIFDMDGVVTAEYDYWEAAALTVYELMYSHRYYGVGDIDREWCLKNLDEIYNIVFCGGRTIDAVKAAAVNTNWDLAYVVFCIAKYLNPELTTFDREHFESVCMFIENIELTPPELYIGVEGLLATVVPAEAGAYKRSTGKLWTEVLEVFQSWYHGKDGLPGVKERGKPLLDLEDTRKTLQSLKNKGIRLGIGTGRPEDEIVYPLKKWGIYDLFDEKLFASYDQVLQAEKIVNPDEPLAKPHPFVFWKAAFGEDFSDKELYDGAVTKEMAEKCLVVGDAASDLLSAKAGGFKFAAVLTGISGQDGRPYFEENSSDAIYNSILDMSDENE